MFTPALQVFQVENGQLRIPDRRGLGISLVPDRVRPVDGIRALICSAERLARLIPDDGLSPHRKHSCLFRLPRCALLQGRANPGRLQQS